MRKVTQYEPALIAESGRNANFSNNPYEYDQLGHKIDRSPAELGLVNDIEDAMNAVLEPEMKRRENLNKSREKMNLKIREQNQVAAKYTAYLKVRVYKLNFH